jgi:hypothetical protein
MEAINQQPKENQMAKSKKPKAEKQPKDSKDSKHEDQKATKKTVTRTLPCKLSEKELAKMGPELAANMDKIEAIEAAKKTADDGFKKDIGMLEEVSTKLRGMLRSGAEEREVKCEEVTDYRAGEVRVTRLDTGETFQKRTMTKDEVQLPLDAAGKKAGKLLPISGGKDRSEVKDARPPADDGPPQYPQAGDTIEVETRAGWKSGKVLPISGSVLDVDVGEDGPVQAPIDSTMWRWPQPAEAGPLKVTVGELDKAAKRKKAGKEEPPVGPDGKPLPF